jgi:uncharacterized membrane protein required for colicin V production
MTLDIVLLVVIAAFTLVGFLTGILRQILRFGCVVLSFILSGPVSKLFSNYVESEHIGPFSSSLFVRLGAWLGLYVLLRIAAFYVNRAVGTDKQGVLRPINRRLGGLLGLLEGVALALVVLWALQIWVTDKQALLFPGLHGNAAEEVVVSWSRSSVGWRLASRYNPLIDYDVVGKINVLVAAVRTPEIFSSVTQDANVKALLNHPKVRAVKHDDSLTEALADRDYVAILRNPNFRAMMSDPEVQQLMRNVRVFDILKKELERPQNRSPKKTKATR